MARPHVLLLLVVAACFVAAKPAHAQTSVPGQTPAPASAATSGAADGCASCHATLEGASAAHEVRGDVHARRGFGCVDCHGGDALAADRAAAHDGRKGYLGVPQGQAVITVCARCHADPNLMRRFAPAQRVDQAAEYATSVHGQRLAAGDPNVATCASCHGGHGVREIKDAKSPVYPLNVAETCARCHADTQHMAGYTTPAGPLPTSQYEEYRTSVHYAALTKQQDLSAPTCNDCHGNHGATPPGVGAVTNVCGTCHAVFQARFETSVHNDAFDRGCVECHSSHAVHAPSDELLGISAGSLCATCHEDDNGAKTAVAMRASIDALSGAIDRSSTLLERLHNAGLEVGEEQLALREARNHLTLTRTEVHAFDADAVSKVVDEGLASTQTIEAAAQAGFRELAYRRSGLAVSMFAILLVVVALVLKIREIERRQLSAK